MVRARVRADLDRLATKLEAANVKLDPVIESSPLADYRYRLIVPRGAWGEYLVSAANDIDYTNVKDTLAPMKTESLRHKAMMACWSAMHALQPSRPWPGVVNRPHRPLWNDPLPSDPWADGHWSDDDKGSGHFYDGHRRGHERPDQDPFDDWEDDWEDDEEDGDWDDEVDIEATLLGHNIEGRKRKRR